MTQLVETMETVTHAALVPAGAPAKGEFRCPDCGYGVTVIRRLPPCPMCSGEQWRQAAWSPFTRGG